MNGPRQSSAFTRCGWGAFPKAPHRPGIPGSRSPEGVAGGPWLSPLKERSPLVHKPVVLGAACLLLLTMFTLSGADPDYAAARKRMVLQQLAAPGRDLTNQAVLEAMGKVPRHEFVPRAQRDEAYADHPLPIGHGQTISQPYIVAYMTEQLVPKPTDRVLEIGTGSGYQAAVLATLVKQVYTIEIVEPLARQAEADLKRLGYTNVSVRAGDGYQGWPEAAPFDAIVVTCAPEDIPSPLVDQLKEGGRMIIPVGPLYDQNLYLLRKQGGKVQRQAVLAVRFVPMTGKTP
jgi:protein-L-isoaspartate(D-aspartate) O-methyltransferase